MPAPAASHAAQIQALIERHAHRFGSVTLVAVPSAPPAAAAVGTQHRAAA